MALISSSSPAAGSRLEKLKGQSRKPGEASFFFYDAHFKNDAVKILPGEYFVHDEDMLIMTTLGSCIAACLWDRTAKVGGMNHFMLPDGAGDSGRYGSYRDGTAHQRDDEARREPHDHGSQDLRRRRRSSAA